MVASVEEMEAQLQAENEQPDFETLMRAQDAYEEASIGGDTDGGELSVQRALSIDAFSGKNIEPAEVGRSQVVDWTLFETIQWMLPSFTRIFAGGDNIVEFMPFDEEDEASAEQESDYLNYLVTQKNDWFTILITWIQDALLSKNGYCMAQIEEVICTEVETYNGQSEEQVSLLLDDDVEVIGQNQYDDPDYEPEQAIDPQTGEPVFDPFTGQPVIVPPTQFFDLQLRQTKPKKKLALRVIPPERTKVDADCTDYTLKECDYFEVWDNVTISSLRQMGFDIADDISADTEFDSLEDVARDELLNNRNVRNDKITSDKAGRKVKARWIWARFDFDNDGISELIYTLRVGDQILEFDYVTRIPCASITPFINTHRHIGTSVSDLVFDIQRIKTAILRNGLDSLYYATTPQRAYSNKVDIDDLQITVPGGLIGVDTDQPDVAGHVIDLPVPFVFPQSQEGLRHMDTVTEARVGVNRIFQGIDEGNLNQHDRIGQLSTMAAQRIEQIARIMGNGIENLFGICHELLIKDGHQADTIKLRGQWVNFDPKQWKTGRDMRIVAPYAAGNKDSLLERLLVIKNVMSEAAAAGVPIVQQDNLYQMALELSKAADIMGEKFFTDPATIPPPEPQPDPTMIALDIEQQKADTDATEVESKGRQAVMDDELERFKIKTNAELQIALAVIKQGGSFNLEEFKANLKNAPVIANNEALNATNESVQAMNVQLENVLQGAFEQIAQAIESASAEKEIVRDEQGNIVGSRRKQANGQ
jgi:hypothetical protein